MSDNTDESEAVLAPDDNDLTKLAEIDEIRVLVSKAGDIRRKLESLEAPPPDRDTIGAFMDYDQQGVAVFLGNGEVAIYHDNGSVMGNASQMGDLQAAVTVTRLRAVADMIERGHRS